MADDPEGLVSFESGGDKFTAVFGFRAMKEVEAHYDKPFFHAIQSAMPNVRPEDMEDKAKIAEASTSIRITDIGVIFRAALLKHHPSLTEDDIDDLIDDVGLDVVGQIIGDALASALVKEGDSGSPSGPPNRRARRAGRTG
jgi:hypothetical protein